MKDEEEIKKELLKLEIRSSKIMVMRKLSPDIINELIMIRAQIIALEWVMK